MTLTEVAVVAGGLLLGYWLVAVFLPLLGRGRDEADDACRPEEDGVCGDDPTANAGRDAAREPGPPDGPPVRREM
jgi:hypothetical protein